MTRRLAAGAALTVLLAFGGWWVLGGAPSRGPRSDEGRPADAPVPITPRGPGAAGWTIAPAQTVAIDPDELPSEGTATIDLALDALPEDGQPLWGRILSMDERRADRERELVARVVDDADRGAVRIEIPVAFLQEGAYLIEIRTTERVHIPLRRYRLDVR